MSLVDHRVSSAQKLEESQKGTEMDVLGHAYFANTFPRTQTTVVDSAIKLIV